MDKKDKTPKSAWRRAEEIAGLILLFWGVYTLLALLEKPLKLHLLGSLAELIVNSLSLFFGSYVAFLFPIVIIYVAICLIRHKDITALGTKLLGLTLLVVSSCILLALFSLNMSTDRPEEHFYLSGILGNFFVQPDGLRLPSYLGVLGTVLLGGCLLIISAMISFDLSLQTIIMKSKEAGVLVGKTAIVPIISQWRRSSSEKKPARPLRALQVAEKKEQEKPAKVVRRASTTQQAPPAEETPSKPVILGQPDLFAQYRLPPLSLLDEPPEDHAVSMSDEELERLSEIIEHTLRDYGIETHVGEITQGPVVTRFELHPAPGVKISKILTLEKELAMVLRANSVRIQAPIPGKSAIGIEIPNPKVSIVYLKEMLQSQKLREHRSVLAFALGQTISGEPYICDLAAMPHLLIAGATGSGKSVCINSIISCLLFRQPPDKVKFLMIDPKRVELSVYEDIPHLIAPVICELREAAVALNWLITIMEDRYKQLVEVGMRNITAYNRLSMEGKPHPRNPGKTLEYMPPIVVVIDELADMMLIARQSVEESIIRLSQLARAVGIHLVIATQRPSVNVITGIIKANFPSRIAFQVSSKVDSRTILDMNGAEVLVGKGDMLYLPGGGHKPIRIQGTFVSDGEVERLVNYIKSQQKPNYWIERFEVERKSAAGSSQTISQVHTPSYSTGAGYTISDDINAREDEAGEDEIETEENNSIAPDAEEVITDELYREAIKILLTTGKASTSYLQRRLKIGYVRAGRLMDMMEADGIVGPARGSKPREILVDPAEYLQNLENEK